MNISFDHLVHFTENPEEAKTAFQFIGFRAINGGQHPFWGTYNCLNYFNHLMYIEWIGINNLDIAKQSENILIQQIVQDQITGDGFSQIAFRTDNILTIKQEIKKKGLTPIGPFEGSRKREDGKELSWSMLFVKDESKDECRFPFFIQWGESDAVRTKQMEPLMNHNIGSPSLSYVGLLDSKENGSIQKYLKLFQLSSNHVKENVDNHGTFQEIQIGGIALRFYNHSHHSLLQLNKPFLCGITGMKENKVITLKGGVYEFSI